MSFSKVIRILYLSLYGGVVLFLLLWVVTAFPSKWAEFQKDEARRKELSEEIRQLKKEESMLRRNQDRFWVDKYFVQKLAHETGYAHEGEIIFEFADATNRVPEGGWR